MDLIHRHPSASVPQCWDYRCVPPHQTSFKILLVLFQVCGKEYRVTLNLWASTTEFKKLKFLFKLTFSFPSLLKDYSFSRYITHCVGHSCSPGDCHHREDRCASQVVCHNLYLGPPAVCTVFCTLKHCISGFSLTSNTSVWACLMYIPQLCAQRNLREFVYVRQCFSVFVL